MHVKQDGEQQLAIEDVCHHNMLWFHDVCTYEFAINSDPVAYETTLLKLRVCLSCSIDLNQRAYCASICMYPASTLQCRLDSWAGVDSPHTPAKLSTVAVRVRVTEFPQSSSAVHVREILRTQSSSAAPRADSSVYTCQTGRGGANDTSAIRPSA